MKILENGIAVIDGDTHISKWVEDNGRLDHDQNMLPLVLRHIRPGDFVVDIGAFIGDHTIAYSNQVTTSGKVFAFEPSEKVYECLVYNTMRLGNVMCFKVALAGKEKFHFKMVHDKNEGASFIFNDTASEKLTMTLDDYELQQCNFIKIDAEGFEIEILQGAEETIKRFSPKMLIEVNRHSLARRGKTAEQLYEVLTKIGYAYANIYPNHSLDGVMVDVLCQRT